MDKKDIIDVLLTKISILEREAVENRNELDKLSKKHSIALQGLRVIVEAGDMGAIASKTIEEINNK